jgi:hypothetical protein
MGNRLYYGKTFGWDKILFLGSDFLVLLGSSRSQILRRGLCIRVGGTYEGRGGDDNCLGGRKNCWKVVVLCFMILFCSIMFLIGGFRGLLALKKIYVKKAYLSLTNREEEERKSLRRVSRRGLYQKFFLELGTLFKYIYTKIIVCVVSIYF